jgi:predicted SprT family Zn-dependent metalloprotease
MLLVELRQRDTLVAATAHMNDNRSRLPDLLTCIDCNQTMKLEKIDPDDRGNDLIQYRCKKCQRIELVRLARARWPSAP